MEPVRLSHRDRGPPATTTTTTTSTATTVGTAAQLPLRPPPSRSLCLGDATAGEDVDEDDKIGGGSGGGNDTALRRLDEDRLLAALLADGSGADQGQRQKAGGGGGGGRASHGATVNRCGGRRGRSPRHLLATRLLGGHPALLDDLCPRLAERMLASVHRWHFNAFLLDRLTAGRCLPTLCLHLLHRSGLLAYFRMDPADVLSFFRLVERGYHTANPYHNALHACDVTQAMFVFCRQPAIRPHLTPLDLLAALVAAVGHDLDHPGVNEKFLVATGSHLAVLYDNVSVLENHHWRSAVSCFVEAGLARYLTDAQLAEFTDLVRALILATDISRQQEFLAQFRYVMDTAATSAGAAAAPLPTKSTSGRGRAVRQDLLSCAPHHRHFILQIAIKCADISNPCRSWPVSRLWSLRACEEFFRQGDRERELGGGVIAVTPICDRFNVTVAKVQVGFYTFVVEPLFREWHRFLASRLSAAMLANFAANQQRWQAEVLHEDEHLSSSDDGDDDDEEEVTTTTTTTTEIAIDETDSGSVDDCGVEVMTVTVTGEEEQGEDNKAKRSGGGVAAAATVKPVSVGLMTGVAAAMAASSCLDRRMSLPSSHPRHHHHHRHQEPLHRIFDQMLQPDSSATATMLLMTSSSDNAGSFSSVGSSGGGSVSLRRNYSLTDRRRSSLLRGLYTRSSLKPSSSGGNGGNRSNGRLSRPNSACLETAVESVATTPTSSLPPSRTLQPMENRLEDVNATAAAAAATGGGMELTSSSGAGGGGGGGSLSDEQHKQLLAVMKKNLLSKGDNDADNEENNELMMMMMTEKENTSSGAGSSSSFHLYQRLTQRRGSAPSNLVLGCGDTSGAKVSSGLPRNYSLQSSLGVSGSGTNRRGSLPSELMADSLPKQLRNRLHAAAGGGGGNGGKSKGLLRRRSMGPEMLLNLNNLHHHHPHHHHHLVLHAKDQQRPQLVQKYMNRPF